LTYYPKYAIIQNVRRPLPTIEKEIKTMTFIDTMTAEELYDIDIAEELRFINEAEEA